MKRTILVVCSALLAFTAISEAKLKALIVDGQNNHGAWPKTTIMMKQYLEDTGLFEVDIARTKYTWKGSGQKEFLDLAGIEGAEDLKEPKTDLDFAPDFKKYDVVVNNNGWKAAPWPKATKKAFEAYMKNGGGLVVIHAADNSWENWPEYNKMIGVGGWGGRNEKSGPYVYYTNEGELVRDTSVGSGGSHGPHLEFPVTLRVTDHPITKGMPATWLTVKDEMYCKLRGPAENMTILATGKDFTPKAKTDRHEPVLMVIDYGKGRVFHNVFGHDANTSSGVGFIVCLQRGAEWAATGKVTQPLPGDFPTAEKSVSRPFELKK